jgi:hypothetical protein
VVRLTRPCSVCGGVADAEAAAQEEKHTGQRESCADNLCHPDLESDSFFQRPLQEVFHGWMRRRWPPVPDIDSIARFAFQVLKPRKLIARAVPPTISARPRRALGSGCRVHASALSRSGGNCRGYWIYSPASCPWQGEGYGSIP